MPPSAPWRGTTACISPGNAYERDTHFPGLYFQTSFLVSADGAVVLRYRRLISLFGPSPYDVYDRYVEIYGADSLFPVADTAIGRVAAVASEEILYPEIARAMALRGAERSWCIHRVKPAAAWSHRRALPSRHGRSRTSSISSAQTPPA